MAVWSDAPANPRIVRVRFDKQGHVEPVVHATVSEITFTSTTYLTFDETGVVTPRWTRNGSVWFDFEFTAGVAGNPLGAVLLDGNSTGGTQLATMDSGYVVSVTNGESIPAGRTDTDGTGFRADVTGLYGGGVLLTDVDCNGGDDLTAVYAIENALTGGTYAEISAPVPCGTRSYGDLDIAASGDFGGVIFVTERLADEIQQVAPDGTHTTWATGFVGIDSLSISPDGNSMYVGDLNGVWLVRAAGNEPGPVVLTHEPNDAGGSHLTGEPTAFFRVIFNEAVSFTDSDVTITNSNGDPVGFDASGSASQFMLIGLAEPLHRDAYTVTIADTVTAIATGEPLDGDNDGFAGGDAVLVFTHRCEADLSEPEGLLDLSDINLFVESFLSGCP
ncbi:MAG: hypothetical protein K8E66_04720 [Phycisphaerales bacterium]|nr:hypothetical protein [Phycisphaerales bacterium]